MPDIAPLVIAVLPLLATVTLGVALYGRRDLSSPRCRRCKADVREKAMDGSFTCACRAELLKRRAVTFPYRVRRRWAVVGLAFALAAFGLGVAETRVLSIGLGWRAVYPNWLFNLTWPHGESAEYDWALLQRRVESIGSRDEARALLEAVLARPGPERPWEGVLGRLVAAAAPSGDLATRAAEAAASTISCSWGGTSIDMSAGARDWEGDGNTSIAVRLDRVTVNGVSVPFDMGEPPLKDPRGAWRELSPMGPFVRLRDPITVPRETTEPVVVVSGEIIYVPFLPVGWWTEDGSLAQDSDPSSWGVDLLRHSFSVTASNAWRRGGVLFGAKPATVGIDRLTPLLGYALGAATPQWLAGLRIVACAVAGTAFGLASLAGIGILRLTSVSPWMLDVAACPRCRSCLRGAGTALPARCPECGTPADPHAVRYARRAVTRPIAVVVGTVVTLALAGTVALVGPETVGRLEARCAEASWDPLDFAAWRAERTLAGERIYDGSVFRGSSFLPMLRRSPNESSDRDRAADVFARTLAIGWREAERDRSVRGRPPSMEERWEWFSAIDAALVRESEAAPGAELEATLVAARDSMRESWGLPGIAVPRAVRVRERIVPRLVASLDSARWDLRVRERRANRASPGWTRPPDSPLRVATDVGSIACELEWTLLGTDDDSLDADAANLCGVIRGTVRVLPNDGPVTVVTDPALNPLDGGATVTLEIRETGERDLVTITADDAAVGVALAGSWRLGDTSGVTPPRVLTRQSGGPWTGLVPVAAWTGDANAGAFDGRPDEVVATFVPDPNAGPIQLDANGIFSILWGAETTVRFRRVPPRGFDVVTRYELVP